MSNSYLWKVSFMCWLAATIRWVKHARCVGVNWEKLWARLKELQRMAPARDTLLLKLGAAKSQYPSGWRLVKMLAKTENFPLVCARTSCARLVSAKVAICFAPTWAAKIPLNFGSSMSCSPKLRLRAPGLTPRSVLEQLSAIQMLDVH